MNTNHEARYIYIRTDKKGKVRRSPITVAYVFNDEDKVIMYNFAKCSKQDVFSRKRGRQVAEGRLMLASTDHPSRTIRYASVSEAGKPNDPRYALINAEIITRINEEV